MFKELLLSLDMTMYTPPAHFLHRFTLLFIALLLAGNGVLGYSLYQVTSAAPPLPTASILSQVTPQQLNPAHPLLGETLQPTSERAILAQQLKLRLWSSYSVTSDNYWHADYTPLSKQWLEHRRRWLLNSRTELLQLFGPSAVYEPLFSDFFFPLRELLPFLSSAAQARLYAASAYTQATQKWPDAKTERENYYHFAGLSKGLNLSGGLNPPEQFEFALRYSPTAQLLRSSGIALQEESFRTLLSRAIAYKKSPNPEHREQLREVLLKLPKSADRQQLIANLIAAD
ncbi:MAG: hypothetical protein ACN4EJ_07240 [Porticoccaceae bacterium]